MFNRVLYTDESKFEIFGTKRHQYVQRRIGEAYQPECLNPTIKHGGGSLQVWGCLSSSGVGDLIKIEGRLTHRGMLCGYPKAPCCIIQNETNRS